MPNTAAKVEFITEEQSDAVFAALSQLHVRLEEDPTVRGSSYVHESLKRCRDYSIQVEELLVQYYNVERRAKTAVSAAKQAYKMRYAELLATDPEIRNKDICSSSADREALANVRCKAESEELHDLEDQLLMVQYILKAIELKREGLNRTNNDIKKQVSLMEFAKSNATPYDGSSDDFEDVGGGPSDLNEDVEEVMALFTQEDPGIQDEQPPMNIPEEVTAHLSNDPDDPVRGTTTNEDVNQYLQDIEINDAPDMGSEDLDEEAEPALCADEEDSDSVEPGVEDSSETSDEGDDDSFMDQLTSGIEDDVDVDDLDFGSLLDDEPVDMAAGGDDENEEESEAKFHVDDDDEVIDIASFLASGGE